MAFEWNKIHKHEEQIERDIYERVTDYIFEYYGIQEINELDSEQIAEIQKFQEELNEFSVMQCGFSDILNQWEDESAIELSQNL